MKTRPALYRVSFTLVELLLVLFILALLSTLAVNSVASNFEQEYAKSTIKTLKNIEDAILALSENGATGYVAEMGEPPSSLENLWLNPDPAGRIFGKKTADDGSGVEFYCGWRGPYLHLSINQNQLLDAWGGSFELLDQNGYPLVDGAPAQIIRSLGPNHQASEPKKNGDDLVLVLAATQEAVSRIPEISFERDLYRASIDVRIRYQNSEKTILDPDPVHGDIIIRYYSPDPKTGEILFHDVVISAPFEEAEDFRRTLSATIGPRALLAIQVKKDLTITSEITYLNVRRVNQRDEIELILIQK